MTALLSSFQHLTSLLVPAPHTVPQVTLREVNKDMNELITESARYKAILEVKAHCPIDLYSNVAPEDRSPAQVVLMAQPIQHTNGLNITRDTHILTITLPVKEVCCSAFCSNTFPSARFFLDLCIVLSKACFKSRCASFSCTVLAVLCAV